MGWDLGLSTHMRSAIIFLDKSDLAMYGNTYMHYFVLFEDSPPWQIQKRSGPWCFPSTDNASKCDTIQFVMSAHLDESQEELLLAYGINDCDSAIARLPLTKVLAFVDAGGPLVSG